MSSMFTIKHITAVGGADLNQQYDNRTDVNRVFFVSDEAGLRLFQWVLNRSGSAQAQGELVSRLGDADGVTAVSNITAGSTTSATTTGLTASDHVGSLMYVADNDDTAGAAPEGETSPVVANTATIITLDSNYPLTVALAVNDDLSLIAMWNCTDAAIGDYSSTVMGVIVAKDGIADNTYGAAQCSGICPRTLVKASTALTVRQQVIADTARVGPAGASSTFQLVVGKAMAAMSSDIVNDFGIVKLGCGHFLLGGLSDVDATA